MPRPSAKPLTFIDAFAGCGGLSLGLMQAGWTGRFAIERDKFALATLKANLLAKGSLHKYVWPRWLPKEPIGIVELLSSFRNQLEEIAGSVDVLVGGPPCRGFSSAGRHLLGSIRYLGPARVARLLDDLGISRRRRSAASARASACGFATT